MIQLTGLEIQNFLCFSEADLSLDSRGLLCVLGDNRDSGAADSNGAGKSALFEALFWGLFGKTLRAIKLDDVIRRDAEKEGCLVRVSFKDTDTGESYVVLRTRKHHEKGSDVWLESYASDGILKDLRGEKTRSGTQSVIEAVLGMGSDMFKQIVLFGIGGHTRFSELGDAGQKKLLEEILKLSIYERAAASARKQKSDNQKEADKQEIHIQYARSAHAEAKRTHERCFEIAKEYRAQEDLHKARLEREIIELESDIKDTENDIASHVMADAVDHGDLRKQLDRESRELWNREKAEHLSAELEVTQLRDLWHTAKAEKTSLWKDLERLQKLEANECPLCHQKLKKEHDPTPEIERLQGLISEKNSELNRLKDEGELRKSGKEEITKKYREKNQELSALFDAIDEK